MSQNQNQLEAIDHVAIPVKDLSATVAWYQETAACEVVYQDETWALLQFQNVRLAFVLREQHPPHVAFAKANAADFGELKGHRDGTKSVYIKDPSGNAVEILTLDKATYDR